MPCVLIAVLHAFLSSAHVVILRVMCLIPARAKTGTTPERIRLRLALARLLTGSRLKNSMIITDNDKPLRPKCLDDEHGE